MSRFLSVNLEYTETRRKKKKEGSTYLKVLTIEKWIT